MSFTINHNLKTNNLLAACRNALPRLARIVFADRRRDHHFVGRELARMIVGLSFPVFQSGANGFDMRACRCCSFWLIVFSTAALVNSPQIAKCQTIDFETVPGLGPSVDKIAISNQYTALYGVSFQYVNGQYPYLAQTGGVITAFNSAYGYDMPASNQGVGAFFLTDKNVDLNTTASNPPPPDLIISYTTNVAAASGVVLDIDDGGGKTEVWKIVARNAALVPLATNYLSSSNFHAGNALSTAWSFNRPIADINSIVISFIGTKTGLNGYGAGFAFDNFSPALSVSRPRLSLTVTQELATLTVDGLVPSSNRVEFATVLAPGNWQALTNITLTNTPTSFLLPGRATNASEYFRTVSPP